MSTEGTAKRGHTITWEDPSIIAAASRTMGGKDFLIAIREGRVPPSPVASLLGYRVGNVEEGFVTFVLEPEEHLQNPVGIVHGGILCTLLDTAMAGAVGTRLGPHQSCLTVDIKANIVRPVSSRTGTIHAEGRAIHLGKLLATAEARIVDSQGQLFAHAIGSLAIVTGKGAKAVRDGSERSSA